MLKQDTPCCRFLEPEWNMQPLALSMVSPLKHAGRVQDAAGLGLTSEMGLYCMGIGGIALVRISCLTGLDGDGLASQPRSQLQHAGTVE